MRVSTDEQASSGVSLEAQADRVRAHCRAVGLDLVEVIEDAGISAKSMDRPGLTRLLGLLASGAAAGIVVAKLDRVSRSVRDWSALVEDHFARADGPAFFSAGDGFDLKTADGRMVANILMAVAQGEREKGIERTDGAMRHKRSRGEQLGTVPYGRQLGEDGRTLVPCPGELAAIAVIRSLDADGYSLRGIAARLDALGVATRTGRPWAKSTVAEVLRRDAGP